MNIFVWKNFFVFRMVFFGNQRFLIRVTFSINKQKIWLLWKNVQREIGRSLWNKEFCFSILMLYLVYFCGKMELLIFTKTFYLSFFLVPQNVCKISKQFDHFIDIYRIYRRRTDRQRHFLENRFIWLRGFQNVKIWWKFRKWFCT